MGLEINRLDRSGIPASSEVADRPLWLMADQQTLVEDGDPAARFLLAPRGHRLPAAEVARLRLEVVDGRITQRPVIAEKAPAPSTDKGTGKPEKSAAGKK